MDRTAFTHMAAAEATHRWFVGRRAVIEALLDREELPAFGAIHEAGCGTGGDLATLVRRGAIAALGHISGWVELSMPVRLRPVVLGALARGASQPIISTANILSADPEQFELNDDFGKYGRIAMSYDHHPRYCHVEGDAEDVGSCAKSPWISTKRAPQPVPWDSASRLMTSSMFGALGEGIRLK